MEEEVLSLDVHNEFAKRMDGEHDEFERRLTHIENKLDVQTNLLTQVAKLASNMESMAAEQSKQGERLDRIEARGSYDKLMLLVEGVNDDVKKLDAELAKVRADLEDIESRDGKTWRNIKLGAIGAAVAGLVAWAMARFGVG